MAHSSTIYLLFFFFLKNSVCVGNVKEIDTNYYAIAARNERPLNHQDAPFFNKTASDDPIIRKMAQSGIGHVFATDSIISLLMSCTRAVYPWDIVIKREGDKLFFDKREGSKIGK